MKNAALCGAALLWAALAFAEEPAESPLVKAARQAKESREKNSSAKKPKVITNADVKKSKGKLIVVGPSGPAPKAEPQPTKPPIQQQDDEIRARADAVERVENHEKKVAELEKELRRVEQSYYEENDPNYRDDVIQKRFDQTRKQLDEARKNLAMARDALLALFPKE